MFELSHYILDLIENSLTAGASTIKITVMEDKDLDVFEFEIADNGCGISKEIIEEICDPFVTSRTTRKVGLGLALLCQATRICGGDMSIWSEKGEGTTVRATFQYSHIDRMPMGDIASTIMAAIAAKPEINLVYRHMANGREFVFDMALLSREFAEKGMLFNEVGVLIWIKRFFADGMKKLYTGVSNDESNKN